jgi:hypothetical protein
MDCSKVKEFSVKPTTSRSIRTRCPMTVVLRFASIIFSLLRVKLSRFVRLKD